MIIDIRYHIASLVAVFLALGIGILIGSALLGNDALVLEQNKMISRLEQEFDRLKEELRVHQETIKKQEVELQVDRQFHRSIIPVLAHERLLDRRISLVRTNDSFDLRTAKELAQLLRSSGADVPSITTFRQWPNLSNPLEKQSTALVLGKDPNQPKWVQELFADIIEELAAGESSAFLTMMQAHDFLELSGDYSKGPVDTIVILGGEIDSESQRVRDIDLPLIDAARRLGLAVVGAEQLKSPISYVKEYRKKGITTVDNIETIPGQIALLYVLSQGKKGSYGVKESARVLMPEIIIDKKSSGK